MRVILEVGACTYDDHVDFEDEAGMGITTAMQLLAKGSCPVRAQRALVWVLSRRFDRTFSLDDAGALRPGEVEWTIPKAAPDEPAEDAPG